MTRDARARHWVTVDTRGLEFPYNVEFGSGRVEKIGELDDQVIVISPRGITGHVHKSVVKECLTTQKEQT